MPFIIPISTFEDAPPVSASFAGETTLQAAGAVAQFFRATLQGSTTLAAALAGSLAGSTNFAGSTQLQATGRLNAEANVFGAADLEGSTALEAAAGLGVGAGAVFFEGLTDLLATGLVASAEEVSFAFIVDVLNPAASAAYNAASNVRRFSVRLLVNGSAVPLRSATLNAPPDALGVELAAELARPVASQIPADAAINFQLGIWTGAAFAFENLLSGGRLAARSKRVRNTQGRPTDTLSVSFVDLIGDRWNLAPASNTIIYDPDKVERPATTSNRGGSNLYVRRADGTQVEEVATAVPDLKLYEVLRRAYVVGCGFDSVKTNLPNFEVEQVAFTLSGGYDAGVRPLLKPFSPAVFPVGNVLWIVNADAPVPAGLTARPLTVKHLVEITSTLPNREPVDGLLATIKADAEAGEYFTERLEVETVESGTFGTSGFTSTRTENRVREYRSADEPGTIRREELASSVVEVTDFEFRLISRDTQTNQFDGLNRKVGHTRSVESLLPVPDTGELELQESSRERQTIVYGAHPLKPWLDTILRVETHVDGLILIDEDNPYLEKPFRSPLAEAHRSGNVSAGAGQSTEFGAIRSTFEILRVRGDSVEMETRVINHLANTPDRLSVTTRPGASEIARNSQATQTILLTLDGATHTRRVAEFDASGLPRDVGLELSRRELRRLVNPPLEFAGVLSYPDRTLRRGNLYAISERGAAALGVYVTLGYKFDFNLSASGALEIAGSLTARQLTNQ